MILKNGIVEKDFNPLILNKDKKNPGLNYQTGIG
jgi:hypothetical protein